MYIDSDLKKIFFNTITQFGSKGVTVLLSLLAVSLLTRYLGAEGYGSYILVITYLSFFGLVADLGLNVTLTREFSRTNNISSKVKATFLNVKLILILISIILPIFALIVFPYSSYVKTAIIIGSFSVAVGNLISYGTSILQSQLRLYLVATIEFVTSLVTIVSIIVFIQLHLGLYFIIGGLFVGNCIGLGLTIYYIRNTIVLRPYIDKKILQELAKIALPIGFTAALSMLYFKIDTIMLSVMKTTTDVGIYGLAYNVLDNILMFWALFMASVFPLLSKFYGAHDPTNFRRLLKKTFIILVCLATVIIFFGNIFNYFIIRILAGSKLFSSMEPLRILLWSVPFLFINNIFYNIIVSFGKTQFLIHPLLISLIINILLNLYAIPRFGYIGASYTTVITEFITMIVYLYIILTKFRAESEYLKLV
jgi:O-antigen/teichoic acid export membrane protein